MTPAERRRAGVAKLARLLGAGPGPGAARTEVRVLRQIVRAGEGGDVEGVLRLAQDRRVCCPGADTSSSCLTSPLSSTYTEHITASLIIFY